MFPDYPEVKRKAERALRLFVHQEIVRHSPILAEVRSIRQHEGRNWSQGVGQGQHAQRSYDKVEAEFTLTRQDLRTGGVAVVKEKYSEIAEVFAEHQTRDMFAKIGAAADSAGNVIRADGEVTQDQYLQLLERLQVRYDDETRLPMNLTMVASPALQAKLIPKMAAWENDADFCRRRDELHERKWLESRDRESRHRLVD